MLWCHMQVFLTYMYVAVPGRNETLFHCVFQLHYYVQSGVAQTFHKSEVNTHHIYRGIRYSWIYTGCMSPTLDTLINMEIIVVLLFPAYLVNCMSCYQSRLCVPLPFLPEHMFIRGWLRTCTNSRCQALFLCPPSAWVQGYPQTEYTACICHTNWCLSHGVTYPHHGV